MAYVCSIVEYWTSSLTVAYSKTYNEQPHHHADMRINKDLNDGVKVNFDKFEDLLAEGECGYW